jgi:hypothetical protein
MRKLPAPFTDAPAAEDNTGECVTADARSAVAAEVDRTSQRDGAADASRRRARRSFSSRASGDHAPQRLAAALKLLAAGERYTNARDALMAKFSISRATAERDLARAYAEIAAEAEAERPTLAARIADRVWRLGLRAERRKDDHLALAAYQSLAKLVGVGAERVVVESTDAAARAHIEAMHFALTLTPAQRANEKRKSIEQLRALGVDVDARLRAKQTKEGDHDEG